MKIKELDFSAYTYTRICVTSHSGSEFFPPSSEDAVIKACGEYETSPEGISATEDGWLVISAEKTGEGK